MRSENVFFELSERMKRTRSSFRVVDAVHTQQLDETISEKREKGLFDSELFREYLSDFRFLYPEDLPDTRSIIIIATPQPHIRVTFDTGDGSFPVLIPTNYSHITDTVVQDDLRLVLEHEGFGFSRANLPLKTLAVRSGMAKYGRNNISYIDGYGSFFRLTAFFSDLPCVKDSWYDLCLDELCENCRICRNRCPTGAIDRDRFLLRAERCLTFHNERTKDLPRWIDPQAHNCLVGCISCQDRCPLNRDVSDWIEDQGEFSREETELMLAGVPEDRLPKKLINKFRDLGLVDGIEILSRNLRVLAQKSPGSLIA